jgi:hypothetical protein
VTTINLETTEGTVAVEAKEIRGHFAIHRPLIWLENGKPVMGSREWVVTHIPSGRQIFMVSNHRKAKRGIRELERLRIDWSKVSPTTEMSARTRRRYSKRVRDLVAELNAVR